MLTPFLVGSRARRGSMAAVSPMSVDGFRRGRRRKRRDHGPAGRVAVLDDVDAGGARQASQTASVSCGKNDGGDPSRRSYHSFAVSKSATRMPANRSTGLIVGRDGDRPRRAADLPRGAGPGRRAARRASRRGRGAAGDGRDLQDGQGAAPRRAPGGGLGADRAVLAATATAAPGRVDDETNGIPLVSTVPGASAGTLMRARPCYKCKDEVHRGRRLLPPALPVLRGAEPAAARGAHRPDRAAGAADRRAGEDRHVHRAAAAARRRADHDHHTLPEGRRAPVRGDAGQRPTGSTGWTSSASTCASPGRSSRWPTRSPPRARSTS